MASSTVSALLGWSYLVGRTQGTNVPPVGAGFGTELDPPTDVERQGSAASDARASGGARDALGSLEEADSAEATSATAWTLRPDRSIVQVSGREGFFSATFKDSVHPHTNAAKAALHMLVKTAAPEFAAARIFMNVVDTGWISTMHPTHKAATVEQGAGFVTPLDSVDGAARILDPWFSSIAAGTASGVLDAPPWGMVIKDFRFHGW
ncbi:hypothetical protein FNF27_01587 [Cafeteria roenbergensis]|uniref:Uncharacterized protein n=1 Tax=Cafeteria roenbergensis TaxID=33653 RepID=A0A5A8EFV1_CAFRO|nr:hypothetical protein FNF27_01587 [Cafeteria roenbergensis]